MTKSEILLIVGVALLPILVAAFFGRFVPVADQAQLHEALRTVASILFAIIGGWIALIYPRALEQVLRHRENSNDSQVQNVRRLLRPFLYSTIVLAAGLIFNFLHAVLKNLPFMYPHTPWLRSISLSMLTLLVLIQLWAVLLTLGSTEALWKELEVLQERSEYLKKLTYSILRRGARGEREE